MADAAFTKTHAGTGWHGYPVAGLSEDRYGRNITRVESSEPSFLAGVMPRTRQIKS